MFVHSICIIGVSVIFAMFRLIRAGGSGVLFLSLKTAVFRSWGSDAVCPKVANANSFVCSFFYSLRLKKTFSQDATMFSLSCFFKNGRFSAFRGHCSNSAKTAVFAMCWLFLSSVCWRCGAGKRMSHVDNFLTVRCLSPARLPSPL